MENMRSRPADCETTVGRETLFPLLCLVFFFRDVESKSIHIATFLKFEDMLSGIVCFLKQRIV
jgi:hypothetical protein